MFNSLTEVDGLTPDTRLFITDATMKNSPSKSSYIQSLSNNTSGTAVDDRGQDGALRQALSIEEAFAKNGVERIHLSSSDRSSKLIKKDPLSDDFYFKAHRRAQRQEKSARNIEKEHAMHEKVQLETLLGALKGHGWLKVMGISGITDSEKKLFEPKRNYFIREVEVLIEKFRLWKEEEKRRKVIRVQEEDDMSETHSSVVHQVVKRVRQRRESKMTSLDVKDADAKAAQQLQQEAKASSSLLATQHSSLRKEAPPPSPGPSLMASKPTERVQTPTSQPSEKPLRSFFKKAYQRDAALGSHRRGRARLAFGIPVPELLYSDFGLPDDILTPEVTMTMERKRRAVNRDKDGA